MSKPAHPLPPRVVLAVDGSTCAESAAAVAFQIASTMQVTLTIVHVVNVTTATGNALFDFTHRIGFEPAVVSEEIFNTHLDTGKQLLAKFEERARSAGLHVKTRVLVGAVGPAIVHATRHADLLVVGLRGETEDRFPGQGGSLASSFLHDISVPILVVPKDVQRIKAVALGYDGSVGAAHAVTAVRHFLLPLGVEAHAIHVGDDGSVLAEVDPNLPGIVVHHHVIPGADAHEALARSATEKGCQVLALGFRGQSRLKDFMFGSATEFIVLSTKLALLVTH